MSNPRGNKVASFKPDMSDLRVTFLLKGEEALEFRRYLYRNNIRANLGGRSLLVEGLKAKNYLPKWWRTK